MISEQLKELGFSSYEIACYLALVAKNPANGSQLSKVSGLARSRIYDTLRNLTRRGFVDEVGEGMYVPLPPEELIRRLRKSFEANLAALRAEIDRVSLRSDRDHIWTMRGVADVLAKAEDMIDGARQEIYIRFFSEEGRVLKAALASARQRGVEVKYVALGEPVAAFDHQVDHRDADRVREAIGGRCLDLVTDRDEALSGIFRSGEEDDSPINWSRNRTMVLNTRERMRHEFFSAYLHKTLDRGEPLNEAELATYKMINEDF